MGLKSITGFIRKKMTEIETDIKMDELGYFTHEEHADDISTLVQIALGLDPVEGWTDLFKKVVMSPEDRKQCDSFLEKDKLPPSGSFTDPHRANCYRIVHIRDLVKEFKRSGRSIQEFSLNYIASTISE